MCYIKKKNNKQTTHYTFNLEMITEYDSRLIRKKPSKQKSLRRKQNDMEKSLKNRGGKSLLGFLLLIFSFSPIYLEDKKGLKIGTKEFTDEDSTTVCCASNRHGGGKRLRELYQRVTRMERNFPGAEVAAFGMPVFQKLPCSM